MQRARRWLRRDDGAVAVEAAIVIPVLCFLVFGMIEFAFAMKDYASVSSMARTGARMGSTAADAGPATCYTYTGAPTCTTTSAPAAAQLAADAIQRSGAIADPTQINYILVYKANTSGFPGADSNTGTMPSSCSGYTNCVMFNWVPSQSAFRYAGGSWNSTTISACFPGTASTPLDRIGVYVNTTHKMMTGLFGSSITIKDRAVMDFEPLPTISCNGNGAANGGHQ
jgi:Flp pilus assembly protein TadG